MTTQKSKVLVSASSKAVAYEPSFIQQGENFLYDARLLHKDLQVKVKFEDWIRRRISDFKFEEGVDFFANLRKSTGGRRATEYLLTIDMCKELGMLERSEIGRAIRKAFIQKEKESRIGLLPKDSQVFKGLKKKTINGRNMYAFKLFLREKAGYSDKSSGYHYRAAYPNHFVVMDGVAYISEELALQIFHSRRLVATRKANKAMQPVLPFNFGEMPQLKRGGSHV